MILVTLFWVLDAMRYKFIDLCFGLWMNSVSIFSIALIHADNEKIVVHVELRMLS